MSAVKDRRSDPKTLTWRIAMKCHRDRSTASGLARGHNGKVEECRRCAPYLSASEAYIRDLRAAGLLAG